MTDLHERFAAWLEGSPDRDPARDMAVHAAFCPDCQLLVTARDALAVIDLGGADHLAVPAFATSSSTPSGPFQLRVHARILAAVVLVVATGVLLVQSIDLAPASGTAGIAATAATPSPVAAGAVLGATGTPAPSVTPSIEPLRKVVSPAATRTTPQPSAVETDQPLVSVPIAPPTAAPATPEPIASASLAPTKSPAPTPSATPTPTVSPVDSPTVTPTPAGTDTPTPTESPAASPAP